MLPQISSVIRNEKVLIFLLAVIQFTHIIDFMIMMPLGKQFIEAFDINPQQFTILVSAYAFSAFVAGLIGASVIDRFDRRHALLFLFAGFTIGTFACAVAPTYRTFLGARALTGAFGGSLGALVLSIVGDVIPFERRGAAIGQVMTAFSVASIVGVPAGIFLAKDYGLAAPFLTIAAIATIFWVVAYFVIPSLRGHLEKGQHSDPTEAFRLVKNNGNQQRALLFGLVLILGHFSIIPLIAPFMQFNVGFTEGEVAMMYAIGGCVTVVCLPLFGRLADRYGHIPIFTFSSIAALFSIYAITNLPVVALPLALLATSSLFLVASGRNVPATTLVTSVVSPENRGSFMSIRTSVNEAGLAIAAFVSGQLVTENPDGSIGQYDHVGYFAIVMSILAILLARRLRTIS